MFHDRAKVGCCLNRSQGYIVLATLGLSFALVFSTMLKDTGMSSPEQLLFRFSFGLAILAVFMLGKRRFRRIQGRDVSLFVLLGVIYSFFTLSGLTAIALETPIAMVSALVYTQPIFTAIISQLTGREKVTKTKVGIILVGFLGVFLVSGLQITNLHVGLNIIFPVLAGFFYAVYLWLKRQATGKTEYAPYQILFYTFLFALPPIIIIRVILQNVSTNPSLVGIVAPNTLQLGLLLLFAVFSTILPYGLLNYVKVEEVSPTTEGLLLLGDPVLHSLWAILFFKQYVTVTQYVGAGLILLSAAINLKMATRTG
jgi:drug/metabolite transporter (DMT)-like permease